MFITAYLDPGSGSLVLQALVGGSAGAVVFARYLWQTYFLRQKRIVAARLADQPARNVSA